jgi:predicted dehydrogenase/uncharacterized protein YbjT (DUF2867 family)
MKIFITGANGFIGQHLVNYLSNKNYDVYPLIRKGSLPGFDLNKNINVVYGDILDIYSMEKAIPDGCVMVNLAANPYDPMLSRLVNVGGTGKLISVSENKIVDKFIHISSQATKIKNKGIYAITKGESDELVKNSKLNWVILKPSLVYGEGEKGLFNKIKGLVSMLPFVPVFGDGKVSVAPVYVLDLCKYIEMVALDKTVNREIYDIGCQKPISYNYFYEAILKRLSKKNPLLHIPTWMGIMAGIGFRILGMKNPPFFVDNVLGSTQETNCDATPIIKKYKFKPMNFDKGLDEIFNKKMIRVGVVGLGKMGMMHLAAINSLSNVKVVALVDSNIKSWGVIKSMGTEGNFYASLQEALEKEKIDKMFVLTPTFTHKKILLTCLKKGLSVFVEKPLCLDAKEIDDLKEVVKNYPNKVFVGYTLLFKRVVVEVKRIVDSKKYGEVMKFSASYKHGEVFAPRIGWMFDKSKSGGGVLMNPGPHLFSVVSYLLGKAKKIDGRISSLYSPIVDDEVNLTLDYGKFMGNMYLSWSVKGIDIPQMNFEIEFEKARVVTNGKTLWITVNGKTETILENDLPPIVPGLMELNPDANGEAYVTEDYLFVNSKTGVTNDLSWVLQTESMIHDSYKVGSNK